MIVDIKKLPIFLQTETGSYEWGLSARSVYLLCMWKSHPQLTMATRKVIRLYMLCLKHVTIFRNKLYETKASVTLFACCFYITVTGKRHVFIRNGSVPAIFFQVRILKTLTFENHNLH